VSCSWWPRCGTSRRRRAGLDAALRALAQQAYGPWLLLLTAIGFAAYGLFSIAEARYREV
jgi:hypothetical protein